MKTVKRGFTVQLDGIMLQQIDQRAVYTGRRRSGEVGYLLSKALENETLGDDIPLDLSLHVPHLTSVYLEEGLLTLLSASAAKAHRSVGSHLNVLLKQEMDRRAKANQETMDQVAQRSDLTKPEFE